MDNPIYFTKIEYRETFNAWHPTKILFLNLLEKELSYQVIKPEKQMPAIEGIRKERIGDNVFYETRRDPAKITRNVKTGFQPELLIDTKFEDKVVFSYGIKLTDVQMAELLPHCNALDFEPYRDRKMSMDDKGYVGYRDEEKLSFTAITDSYIPKIKLPMQYYYDEAHIWPSEKLYRYLIETYFSENKKTKGWVTEYGALSCN